MDPVATRVAVGAANRPHPGELASGDHWLVEDAAEIARHLSLKKSPVVLVANEGAVVVGRTLLEAFDRLEVLEATAEAVLTARPLGPLVPMSDAAMAELARVFGL